MSEAVWTEQILFATLRYISINSRQNSLLSLVDSILTRRDMETTLY